jgi:UDP-glucose 4-epimerase
MRILVVGGAGYIGAHMVKFLGQMDCFVTTIDDLSSGYRSSVLSGDFVLGNIADKKLLNNVLNRGFDAVMHFASFIQVGESSKDPSKYYQNNVGNTLNLLDSMCDFGIKNFIFSSTAAIFGEPLYSPIDEKHPHNPINPYGRTKYFVEKILADYDVAYGLKSVSLRYFNAAGADIEGQLGEMHEPETHLIPLILQVASGRRSHVSVFGRNYDTPDGTCVRDYVHVQDLCSAHWLALQNLISCQKSKSYNLGNNKGYSVQEVIDTAERVTGKKIQIINSERREGDPARLVADSRMANQDLGWYPEHSDLTTIIKHAWLWEKKLCERL